MRTIFKAAALAAALSAGAPAAYAGFFDDIGDSFSGTIGNTIGAVTGTISGTIGGGLGITNAIFDGATGVFNGITVAGMGTVTSLEGMPALGMASATARKLIGAPLPGGQDPAAFAPKAGAQLADALWGDQKIKGLCTFTGSKCAPALSALVLSTAQKSADFKGQICTLLGKVNRNYGGFNAGFNGQLDKDIAYLPQQSEPANADFSRIGC